MVERPVRTAGQPRASVAGRHDRRHPPGITSVIFERCRATRLRRSSRSPGRESRSRTPDKVLFPDAGYTKLDLARYYLAVADGALRGAGGRPNVLVRYPNGIDGEFFFQKRAPRVAAAWIEVVDAAVSVGPHRRRSRAARRGGARLDGQPRLPRAASAPGARRRSRPSRRAAHRSRSGAGRRVAADPRGRRASSARRSTTSGWSAGRRRRARAACTSTCASSGAGRSTRCAAPRSRSRARSSGARRRWRPASGGRRSATACSSTTTRTRRTARSPRAYSVRPDAGRARVGAAGLGRDRRVRPGRLHAARRCRRGSRQIGDRHAGIDEHAVLARRAARAVGAAGARRAGRRAVAAALPEAGRRAAARAPSKRRTPRTIR